MTVTSCTQRPSAAPTVILPEAQNAKPLSRSRDIVTIARDPATRLDMVWVDGNATALPDLAQTFRDKYQAANRSLIVEAARDVRFGSVLNVLAAATGAGFDSFGLAARGKTKTNSADSLVGFQENFKQSGKVPAIAILVAPTDRVWIGSRAIPDQKLYAGIAAAIDQFRRHGAAPHVSLAADSDASWGIVIRILDACRQAGDEDVGFVTQ